MKKKTQKEQTEPNGMTQEFENKSERDKEGNPI